MSWKAIGFTGGFQDAVHAWAKYETTKPDRVAVSIDDWYVGGGRGHTIRFAYLVDHASAADFADLEYRPERKTFDAIPDMYVPRGTFIAMWREPRGFAQDLWSKWWGSQ